MFKPENVETSRLPFSEAALLTEAATVEARRESLVPAEDTIVDMIVEGDRDVDESTEANSVTDDDPVKVVFNTVINNNEVLNEDDDEEIVWNPRLTSL